MGKWGSNVGWDDQRESQRSAHRPSWNSLRSLPAYSLKTARSRSFPPCRTAFLDKVIRIIEFEHLHCFFYLLGGGGGESQRGANETTWKVEDKPAFVHDKRINDVGAVALIRIDLWERQSVVAPFVGQIWPS